MCSAICGTQLNTRHRQSNMKTNKQKTNVVSSCVRPPEMPRPMDNEILV